MRHVSALDATGLHALEAFHHRCHRQSTTLLLAGFDRLVGEEHMVGTLAEALERAREVLQEPQPAAA